MLSNVFGGGASKPLAVSLFPGLYNLVQKIAPYRFDHRDDTPLCGEKVNNVKYPCHTAKIRTSGVKRAWLARIASASEPSGLSTSPNPSTLPKKSCQWQVFREGIFKTELKPEGYKNVVDFSLRSERHVYSHLQKA